MAKERALTISFSIAARVDWYGIWAWNATHNGGARADSYMSFLERRIQELASSPQKGAIVPRIAGYRRLLVKRSAGGHGHLVFYTISDEKIEIARIFHTAQDWQTQLSED